MENTQDQCGEAERWQRSTSLVEPGFNQTQEQSPGTSPLAPRWKDASDLGLSLQPSLVTQTHAGGSVGQAGFHGMPFHSNNLQVCQSHTPNFNLTVTGDLLLKRLVIKENPCWFINDPHYMLTRKVSWVTNNFLSKTLWPQASQVRFTLIRTYLLMNWMDLGLYHFQDSSQIHRFLLSISQHSDSQTFWSQDSFTSFIWVYINR